MPSGQAKAPFAWASQSHRAVLETGERPLGPVEAGKAGGRKCVGRRCPVVHSYRRQHRRQEADRAARSQRRTRMKSQTGREQTRSALAQVCLGGAAGKCPSTAPEPTGVSVSRLRARLPGQTLARSVEQFARSDAAARERRNDSFVGTAGEEWSRMAWRSRETLSERVRSSWAGQRHLPFERRHSPPRLSTISRARRSAVEVTVLCMASPTGMPARRSLRSAPMSVRFLRSLFSICSIQSEQCRIARDDPKATPNGRGNPGLAGNRARSGVVGR